MELIDLLKVQIKGADKLTTPPPPPPINTDIPDDEFMQKLFEDYTSADEIDMHHISHSEGEQYHYQHHQSSDYFSCGPPNDHDLQPESAVMRQSQGASTSTLHLTPLIPILPPSLPLQQPSPTKFTTIDEVLKKYGYPGPMARVNVKNIALELARRTFFGHQYMKLCTVDGKKKNRLPLDPVKMEQIRGILRRVCDKESDFDFDIIWHDIKKSIGQACKNSRVNKT